jgi:SAM-dependent methyltransferase
VLGHIEDQAHISPGTRVIDIGCGPGWYLGVMRSRHPGIAAVGLDLSAGMARATLESGTPAGVADAMQLPVRTASIDVALATHMLYHVPDIALATRELARVVCDTGIVAIVTNGRDHLRELDAVSRAAVAVVGGAGPWTAPARSSTRFLLDDAPALVAPALDVVAFDRVRREIVVPDTAPLVAYVDSEKSLFSGPIPDATAWRHVLAEVEMRVAAVIARDGAFTVHSDVGVILCRARR